MNRKIPYEHFSTSLSQNVIYLNDYLLFKSKDEKINKERCRILNNFIIYNELSLVPIQKLSYEIIEKYINLHENYGYTPDSIINILIYINDFMKYLEDEKSIEYPKIIKQQIKLLINKYELLTQPKGVAFNLDQLNKIREYNENDLQCKICFELIFQLGIQKNDIKYCNKEYLDKNDWCFIKPNGNIIKLNTKLIDIIKNNNLEFKITYHMVNNYLKRITDKLISSGKFYKDNNLNIYDIKASSEKFIITCPNCKNKTENITNNWVLIKYENDDNYRLVCSLCKGAQI